MTLFDYRFRLATLDDVESLKVLIARSIRSLGLTDYTSAQIEGALLGAFGVDTQLIKDQTYFVVETGVGELIGCGGYSYRRTLFGSDQATVRDARDLDPAHEAAKIRAFFIHPDHARRGLGAHLLALSEQGAEARGFHRFEMMATLPGVRLYAKQGYEATGEVDYPLPNGQSIHFIPMQKTLR